MGKDRGTQGMDFGIRVGAIVRRGDAVLLVRHAKPQTDPYWVLPGGRLEPGETIPRCAERELMEETGLRGEFREVLFVGEYLREGRHTVDLFALVDAEGEPELGEDPEVEPGSEPTLREVRWVTTDELAGLDLLPPTIKGRLLDGGGSPAVYLEGDGR